MTEEMNETGPHDEEELTPSDAPPTLDEEGNPITINIDEAKQDEESSTVVRFNLDGLSESQLKKAGETAGNLKAYIQRCHEANATLEKELEDSGPEEVDPQ